MSHPQRAWAWLLFLSLLAWGGYTTLYFIGTPGHLASLVDGDVARRLSAAGEHPALRGALALWPLLAEFGERLWPFAAYVAVCAGGYLFYLGLRAGRTRGGEPAPVRPSPAKLLMLGLACLWLLHTTLFYSADRPQYHVEPVRANLPQLTDQGFAVLQADHRRLLARGCLRPDPARQAPNNAAVYRYSGWCAQLGFFSRAGPPVGLLLLVTLTLLVIGRGLCRWLRLPCSATSPDWLFGLGLGTVGMLGLVWLLGAVSLLTTPAAWVLLLAPLLLGYRHTLYWLRAAWTHHWPAPTKHLDRLMAWGLLTLLALNFLTVLRPFPIGWDDLGRYINYPRQVSEFGQLLPPLPAPQWEYLTALAFLLFGHGSTAAAVLAQQINWLGGLFAVLAVHAFARHLLGLRPALLAALFYYSLPMIQQFAFADLKTEPALLFFGTSGLLAVYRYLQPIKTTTDAKAPSTRWLVVAGLLFAAGFATKPTLVLMALLGGFVLTVALLGGLAGFAVALLSLQALAATDVVSFNQIATMVSGSPVAGLDRAALWLLPTAAGLGLLAALWRKPGKGKRYGLAVAALLGGFLLLSSPWLLRNAWLNGEFSLSAALTVPNTVTPLTAISGRRLPPAAPPYSRLLPVDLQPDLTHPRCQPTARREEVDRYWGYGAGLGHYLGLPWRSVMSLDVRGYYVILSPLLLLTPLLIFYPALRRNRPLCWLGWGTLLYLGLWVIAGNGVPWYGIGLMLGFSIWVAALVCRAPDRRTRTAAAGFFIVALLLAVSQRLWQHQQHQDLLSYGWGKSSADAMLALQLPGYAEAVSHIVELNRGGETGFVYRVGTFIPYFIPRSLMLVPINDNQLDRFNCLNQEQDHRLTLQRLRALGYNGLIVDLNTATIEADPDGTLHRKLDRLLAFLSDPTLGHNIVVAQPGFVYVELN